MKIFSISLCLGSRLQAIKITSIFFIVLLSNPLHGQSYSWVVTDKKDADVFLYGELIKDNPSKIIKTLKNLAPLYAECSEAPSKAALWRTPPLILLIPFIKPRYLKLIYKSFREVLKEEFEKEVNNTFLTAKKNEEYYLFYLEDLDLDKQLLGFAMFQRNANHKPDEVELLHLMIYPAAQGKGLNKILIFSILRLLPNINRIFLFISKANKKAIAAYDALGFSVSDDTWYCCEQEFEYLTTK